MEPAVATGPVDKWDSLCLAVVLCTCNMLRKAATDVK